VSFVSFFISPTIPNIFSQHLFRIKKLFSWPCWQHSLGQSMEQGLAAAIPRLQVALRRRRW
jgi:hypothetical protein